MDTDSVIDVSLSGKPPIDIDHTGELDLWINEGKRQNPFIEFISSGPKSGIQTCSGFNIIKSNGFYLNHTNPQIFDFDALKDQVVAHTWHIPMNNLVLPRGETFMWCHYFRIEVKINPGKETRMPYNKRFIEFPWSHIPKVIETLPLGHLKIPFMETTHDITLLSRLWHMGELQDLLLYLPLVLCI